MSVPLSQKNIVNISAYLPHTYKIVKYVPSFGVIVTSAVRTAASSSLWHVNGSAKAPTCCLHDTQFIFVSALVVANNLFQRLSHHLALTQLGQQNGAQSMVDQCRRQINHRVFFSKYLIKHGGK